MCNYPVNSGDSTPTYVGNCTIAEFIRPEYSEFSDDELVECLGKCSIQEAECGKTFENPKKKTQSTSSIHTQVPDVQLLSTEHLWEHFKINASVKSHPIDLECKLQAWKQALIGILYHNVSYAILLAPYKSNIFELRIKDPESGESHEWLSTVSKEYCFVDASYRGKFDVQVFTDFMEAILDIMIHSDEQ